ncbi:MAG: family 10 glycosylhydrolase [Pyrinomonadaceae bacterium]|nr:family 10 glycosylhydrolase [Pyrinomonadaceae bacterium]
MFALLLLAAFAATIAAQRMPEPAREFRAAWIATVDNIDFPTRKGLSTEEQKAEIIRDLDLARKLRLNAVIFQVRPMADAMYRSDIEPWSEFLTGEMGKPQSFDPLQFVVEEAHKRGILVHAWFNPYRAYHPAAKTIDDRHILKRRPDLVRKYGRYLWLDPTDEEVKCYSLSVLSDVVRRYDIDGVHFDDYFYPYIEKDEVGRDIEFPDEVNWYEYRSKGGKLGRANWRRWHVNDFIARVGRQVKRLKPHVMYGISPFGIWQPMSEKGIEGFNAYEGLYADARKWLQDGTVDYLAPQLYWETARKGQSFPVLLDWWDKENTKGRHLWPGLAAYRIGRNEDWPASELIRQIEGTRKARGTAGAIHFSFKSLRNDLGGVQRELTEKVYTRDAMIPLSSWMNGKQPGRPRTKITRTKEAVRVNWSPGRGERPFWYLVYAQDKNGWSYSVVPRDERSIVLSADRGIKTVIVKAVSRLGVVSR